MEELTNLGKSFEELGSLAENINPAEQALSEVSDPIDQVVEQVQGDIGSLLGG